MKFVLYAKGERGSASLDGLLARGLVASYCVSEDNDPSTQVRCAQAGIPFMVSHHPRDAQHISTIRDHGFDLLVCAGYSKILPEALFGSMRLGAINCHGGKLPEYRGASPIPWQIIQGETCGTAYVLRMTAGIDDGPILASEPYRIEPEDTARHVTDKVTAIFKKIVPDVVQIFSSGAVPKEKPQSGGVACHWTRRLPQDGRIVWSASCQQVVNLIRALDDPYPGAFVIQKDQPIVFRRARVYPYRLRGVAGRCVGRTETGLLILASDGAVEVLSASIHGQKFEGKDLPIRYGETF